MVRGSKTVNIEANKPMRIQDSIAIEDNEQNKPMRHTQALQIKQASIGSISHGTCRTDDLLDTFARELDWQVQRNGEYFSRPENHGERDKLVNLAGEAFDLLDSDNSVVDGKEDEASEMVNEDLINALESFAPPYCYFGTHPGDGSDFGFWPIDIEEIKEQVGFVSSTEQEWPDEDYRGEWLHVNERGNCTLYVRESASIDREIWGLV